MEKSKNYTRIGWCMLYNMWQIKINTLETRVFSCDYIEVHSKTTTNIYQSFEVLKTFVPFKHSVYDDSCVVDHCLVEYLIESGVASKKFKSMCTMRPVKRISPFANCIF